MFAWSQARFYLSGWYGVGSALAGLKGDDTATFERLAAAARARTWPPLVYAFGNAVTSVLTAHEGLMRAYAAMVEDDALRDRYLSAILAEFAATRTHLEELFGDALVSQRPMLTRSIALRAAALRPLHLEQIHLLPTGSSQQPNKLQRKSHGPWLSALLSQRLIRSSLRRDASAF